MHLQPAMLRRRTIAGFALSLLLTGSPSLAKPVELISAEVLN